MNFTNPMGVTVKELKDAIKDWPETGRDGEPTEVWIETGWCLTSPVVAVSRLNRRTDGKREWFDMELESNAFPNKIKQP